MYQINYKENVTYLVLLTFQPLNGSNFKSRGILLLFLCCCYCSVALPFRVYKQKKGTPLRPLVIRK